MAKKRGAETLFFILFLDSWWSAELHPFHFIKGSSTKFSSNSNNMDKDLAKLFDEILLQVFSKVPFDETRGTADKSITKSDVEESYPPQKSLRDANFALSSSKQEEHLARLFDEILLQVFSRVPYDAPFDETRQTVDKSIMKRTMKEKNNPTNDQNHNPLQVKNVAHTLQRSLEEKRDEESSLFHRDASDRPFTTIDKGALQEASSPSVLSRTVPCTQLLQFLQRNIITAAASVAGVLVATVLLLLVLITCIRRKQLLYPPENMTYNIFIMNGKTWWQNSQKEKTRKYTGKQKQLKLNSSV